VWQTAYAPLPQKFALDDANWLNELKTGAYQRWSERRRQLDQLFQTKNLENQTMEKTEFEGKWEIIRSQFKRWWSLITDFDKVDEADIKFFEFLTILQLKYGYDRQVAKDEVSIRVAEYETNLQTIIATWP
jgi:hypothetical protein